MFTDSRTQFSTTTTPDNSENVDASAEQSAQNALDDVFGDDDTADLEDIGSVSRRNHGDDVSDVPRLQSLHTTSGYRDGIAASKEKFLQEGFDEGYSLGAEIGAAAGTVVGVLESVIAALNGDEKMQYAMLELVNQARKELSRESLYASTYFGEDGIWKFETGDDASISFRDVAAKHPLIVKWRDEVEKIAKTLHLRL